ncbi:hypothetical protein GCM10023238_18650 [Streptomyces heliomycini]
MSPGFHLHHARRRRRRVPQVTAIYEGAPAALAAKAAGFPVIGDGGLQYSTSGDIAVKGPRRGADKR